MWIGAPEEENVTLPQKVSQRRVRRHFLELKFTLWWPKIIRGTNVGWEAKSFLVRDIIQTKILHKNIKGRLLIKVSVVSPLL